MDDGTADRPATVADLHGVEGQAELIDGRIVRLPGHGCLVSRIVMEIARSLRDYEDRVGVGEVHTSTLGYVVPTLRSGRRSFCADVSYYVGPFPDNPMSFIDGTPTFAVEVRDEEDYAPAAEARMAAKRADYFEAGSLVVRDVDSMMERIHKYQRDHTNCPITFARGDVADAEPAAPGWRIAVDEVFESVEGA